jgi:hypothetical protein
MRYASSVAFRRALEDRLKALAIADTTCLARDRTRIAGLGTVNILPAGTSSPQIGCHLLVQQTQLPPSVLGVTVGIVALASRVVSTSSWAATCRPIS